MKLAKKTSMLPVPAEPLLRKMDKRQLHGHSPDVEYDWAIVSGDAATMAPILEVETPSTMAPVIVDEVMVAVDVEVVIVRVLVVVRVHVVVVCVIVLVAVAVRVVVAVVAVDVVPGCANHGATAGAASASAPSRSGVPLGTGAAALVVLGTGQD
jgi:hypothetical protein